jgi:hypothetical protein
VALFHATPAHRILAFRAFPTQPAAASLDARCSHVVESAPTFAGCPAPAIAPTSVHFAEPTPRLSKFQPEYPCDHRTSADISHAAHRRTSKPNHERPTPALKRRRRTPKQASTGSASDQRSTTRAGMDPDSRALLRLSSRSLPGTVRHPEKPMLSWPSPPPRPTSSTVGLAPSPLALSNSASHPTPERAGAPPNRGASGYLQPNLGTTPKSHPNLHEVSYLVRLLADTECSSHPPASRRLRGGNHPKMVSLGSASHWL